MISRSFFRNSVIAGFLLIAVSCTTDKQELYNEMQKIDAHVHIRTDNHSIMDFTIGQGFRLLSINTQSTSQERIDEQRKYAIQMNEAYPDRISWLATFSMEGFEEEGWAGRVIRGLEDDFERGAIGVKIWKDIGMTFRDSLGNFILLDDPGFSPVLSFIEERKKPLLTHIGEPRNCWLPLDSMTVKSDRSYFARNPHYHMYLHPEYPSHERLMASRDFVLENYPDLKMIGAHLGSLEWDVEVLAERLDRYPNFAVDMAARICHFQVQDRKKVINFITKYQDRLLYATDFAVSGNKTSDREQWLETEWKSDWTYFSSDSIMTSRRVDGEFPGLDLNPKILRKLYYTNALHWYPGLDL